MNVCKTSMQVIKPYAVKQERSPPTPQAMPDNSDPGQTESTECPPPPAEGAVPSTVALPSPPPQNIYLYQMIPAGQTKVYTTEEIRAQLAAMREASHSGNPAAAAALSQQPQGPTQQPPKDKAKGKKKPRVIHEYYDQHQFVWREFNPEDTVVGDSSDPFIVYLRYASKSIGARRTPWILAKHAKLIKIMQDCLPDFDWRTGEDLLIKARALYLRRKVLEGAVEKLKCGECIGPVTKAAMEGKDDEDEGNEQLPTELKDAKGIQKQKEKETDPTDTPEKDEVSEISNSEPPVSTKSSEGEDTSDSGSTNSDLPPTPPSNDSAESAIVETEKVDLVGENIRELEELKQDTKPDLSSESLNEALHDKANPAEDVSETMKRVQSEATLTPEDEVIAEEKVEVVVPEKSKTPKTEKELEGWEMLQMVINWVKKEFSADEKALARQLANGEISFRFLWLYYTPGTLISLKDPISKQKVGARIESSDYLPQSLQHPPRLEIISKIIDANGNEFFYSTFVSHIAEYDAAKRIEELPVQLLKPDMPLYATLKERGQKFVSLNGVFYKQLDGVLIINRGSSILRVRSKTRVMIDCKAFRESNPSYAHSFHGINLSDVMGLPGLHPPNLGRPGLPGFPQNLNPISLPGQVTIKAAPKDIKTVPEDELVLCAPTVFGYAFTEKAWVQITVDGISEIEWDTDAYQKLVLPEDTKRLVKSLVQACRTDTKLIKDIISTKGSGVVFVLHGDPGTGKTLTAEAIGEELRRPILVVAVSDLGTDPTNVEIRLGNFLRTAEKWDSIVLLDEADIFLEQRGRLDIFRSAMVGVFLRLLEYHNSPMFLTTNRVFALDPAIRSRISIAIKYHPLRKVARKQVWKQLLEMAKATISDDDLHELAMTQVNGREIKNTIRSAQALAVADGGELSMKHIKTVLDVQREFKEDFEGLPGIWNGMGVS